MTDYPRLDLLMNGYLHQDYDLNGDDVPEVMAYFIRTAGAAEAAATAREIRRFIAAGAAEGFHARYPDDVDPAGWEMTAADWLGWIADLLERAG